MSLFAGRCPGQTIKHELLLGRVVARAAEVVVIGCARFVKQSDVVELFRELSCPSWFSRFLFEFPYRKIPNMYRPSILWMCNGKLATCVLGALCVTMQCLVVHAAEPNDNRLDRYGGWQALKSEATGLIAIGFMLRRWASRS